jgi:hypothetical protein
MGEKSTPRPWQLNAECGNESIIDAREDMIADCAIFFPDMRDSTARNQANAALIVKAANNHHALVSVVRELLDEPSDEARNRARALLKEIG